MVPQVRDVMHRWTVALTKPPFRDEPCGGHVRRICETVLRSASQAPKLRVAGSGPIERGADEAGPFRQVELDGEDEVKADLLGDLQLDRWEAAGIALGLQVGADLLLVDEERGRRTAMSLGLTLTGSIGLVLKAWRNALIPNPEDVLRRLIHEGLWLSPRLLRWFDDRSASPDWAIGIYRTR